MDTSAVEKLLKESIGLNVSSIGKNNLTSAIKKRIGLLNFADEAAYSRLLKTSMAEVNELIEEVTVNETWFFRDQMPFTAMAEFANTWRKNKLLAKLNILSLPCSTGEEPYSIAITLLEAGWNEYSFHIDAVDINGKVLDTAAEAVYSQNSFRGRDKYYIDKYFRISGKDYVLRNKFKNTIKFQKGNLIRFAPMGAVKRYDIIFCRNLLIYLDQKSQENAVKTLDDLLAPGGLLFVGHSEMGVFSGTQFTTSPFPKSFSLLRKSDTDMTSAAMLPLSLQTQMPGGVSVKAGKEPETKHVFKVDEIVEARYYFEKKDYAAAISLCEKHVEKNGPTSATFMFMGIIYNETEDASAAIQMLKKAIYLDPDNLEAMELLSSIFSKTADRPNRLLTNKRIQRVKKRLGKKKLS